MQLWLFQSSTNDLFGRIRGKVFELANNERILPWHNSAFANYVSSCSNFSDVFDVDHFITALKNDVKIVRKLPAEHTYSPKVIKQFRSWSGMDYYQDEIATLWEDHEVAVSLCSTHLAPGCTLDDYPCVSPLFCIHSMSSVAFPYSHMCTAFFLSCTCSLITSA